MLKTDSFINIRLLYYLKLPLLVESDDYKQKNPHRTTDHNMVNQLSLFKTANMKYLIGILAIVFFISGCNSKRFFEKIGLEVEITNVIQIRNEIAYLPNENEPFTGKYEEYYSTNGQKKSETSYKDGKQNGLFTSWYENGKKMSETNYIDGEVNGLFTWWYENGQKMSETNYIDGKANGVTIEWDENGQKKGESNYQDVN